MDCDLAPPFPLFYRDLFIHFPAAAGREFCEYLPRPVCVRTDVHVSVCGTKWAIVRVFVTLYVFVQVWKIDTLWTGGPIIWALYFFSRGGEGDV